MSLAENYRKEVIHIGNNAAARRESFALFQAVWPMTFILRFLMMKLSLPAYIALLVLCSGCKAIKTLTAKDNSASQPAAQANNTKTISFLDDITVTPGTSTEKNVTTAKGRRPGKNNTVVKTGEQPKTIHPVTLNSTGTTNPAMLQLKYASLLNVGPEQLTNTQLLQTIDHWWGTKYCYGGSTEDCVDCSGFTQLVLMDVYNIHIPRVAQDQYDSTERIKENKLTEGDLVFFHTTGRGKSITHVGVYITNNKFAHASTSDGVVIADLNDPYWKQRYRGAGSAFANNTSPPNRELSK